MCILVFVGFNYNAVLVCVFIAYAYIFSKSRRIFPVRGGKRCLASAHAHTSVRTRVLRTRRVTAASVMSTEYKSAKSYAYKDKEKPHDVRVSNITAAKGRWTVNL